MTEINAESDVFSPDPEQASKIFHALGSEKRWEVYRILLESKEPKTVSELAALVGEAHIGNFGNQIKDLEVAGLIRTTKSAGKRSVEIIRNEYLEKLLKWLLNTKGDIEQ